MCTLAGRSRSRVASSGPEWCRRTKTTSTPLCVPTSNPVQKRCDRAGRAGQRRHALPGVCSLAIHQQRQLGGEWRERGAPCGRTRTLGDEDLLFSELGFEGSKTVLAKNSPTFSGQLVVKSLYKVTFCKVKTPRTKISSPGLLIPAASLLSVAVPVSARMVRGVRKGRPNDPRVLDYRADSLPAEKAVALTVPRPHPNEREG